MALYVRSTVLCLLLLTSWSSQASSKAMDQNPQSDIISSFLTTLPGPWHGRAIETPVGPVNYDIQFHHCADGRIAGIAKLRPSNHHWQFQRAGDSLGLTFMSTFGGNTQPVELVADRVDSNSIHLYAPKLDLLALQISAVDAQIDIRVFHHQQPHVHIRLDRQEATTQPGDRKDQPESCRVLGTTTR